MSSLTPVNPSLTPINPSLTPHKSNFKLGITVPQRPVYNEIDKRPVIRPGYPQPNVFFTQVSDNREQIKDSMRKKIDFALKERFNF